MAFAVARTRDEAHLYLDLHPCRTCGSVETDWSTGLTTVGGELVNRYAGACGECEEPREYPFGLPDRPVAPQGYPRPSAATSPPSCWTPANGSGWPT